MDRQTQEVMVGTVPTMSYMMKVPNMGLGYSHNIDRDLERRHLEVILRHLLLFIGLLLLIVLLCMCYSSSMSMSSLSALIHHHLGSDAEKTTAKLNILRERHLLSLCSDCCSLLSAPACWMGLLTSFTCSWWYKSSPRD